jgi:hypothetical protein
MPDETKDVKVPERTMNDDMEAVRDAEDFYNAMWLAGFTRESITGLAQHRQAKKPWSSLDNKAKASLCKAFMLLQDVRKVRAVQAADKAKEKPAPEAAAKAD